MLILWTLAGKSGIIHYSDFYYENQKRSIGAWINNAGYQVMAETDWSGKRVLEIGPGDIQHMSYWWHSSSLTHDQSYDYVIADIQRSMLERTESVLNQAGIQCTALLLDRNESLLPFDDGEFDSVVSFYSLELIYPLEPFLDEIHRILKPRGQDVGAISLEGGVAWGAGRYLTSRRWLKRRTTIDPDKIICWEHPNFADHILTELDARFENQYMSFWPFRVPSMDANLINKFIYRKA